MNIAATTTAQRTRSPRVMDVAPGLTCLPESIVNIYFFGEKGAGDRRWVLIDTGLPFSGSQIRKAAEAYFGANARPAAIILTHGHFDHVGGLTQLAEEWDAPVFAHDLELPYLRGKSAYPPPDPAVGGGLMAMLSPIYPRGPIDLGARVQALPADGSVPEMPDWRWMHTPGHAPGHASLFREDDRALIVGDAFVTTKQESLLSALLKPKKVSRPPAYFTCDWDKARDSVELLALLRPSVAATGHGIPLGGDSMRRELESLVDNWDVKARPEIGRYVREGAVTDRSGFVSAPPAVVDPNTVLAASLGAGLIAGLYSNGRTRVSNGAARS